MLKQYGEKKSDIKFQVEREKEMGKVHRFSPKSVILLLDDEMFSEDAFCGCRRQVNRVNVLYRLNPSELLPQGGQSVLTAEYGWDGKFLVEKSGLAYRRVA